MERGITCQVQRSNAVAFNQGHSFALLRMPQSDPDNTRLHASIMLGFAHHFIEGREIAREGQIMTVQICSFKASCRVDPIKRQNTGLG